MTLRDWTGTSRDWASLMRPEKINPKAKFSQGLLDEDLVLGSLELVPGQTIVDAGCGTGYMACEMAKRLSGRARIIALDRDTGLLNLSPGEAVFCLKSDITEHTGIREASVDLVFLALVFHIFNPLQIQGFDREVKRILRPGGRLAVVNINKSSTPFGPPLEQRTSPEELTRLLTLSPSALIPVGKYFYMQVFSRR